MYSPSIRRRDYISGFQQASNPHHLPSSLPHAPTRVPGAKLSCCRGNRLLQQEWNQLDPAHNRLGCRRQLCSLGLSCPYRSISWPILTAGLSLLQTILISLVTVLKHSRSAVPLIFVVARSEPTLTSSEQELHKSSSTAPDVRPFLAGR